MIACAPDVSPARRHARQTQRAAHHLLRRSPGRGRSARRARACIYPRPPLAPLKDVDAAIRYAINHPLRLRAAPREAPPGDEGRHRDRRHLAAAAADAPPRRARARAHRRARSMLADHGVDDVEMIIATSVHRRMTADEIRHIVGDKIFDAYWPDRLYNHDAEDPNGMKYVGTTELGEVVELNKKAVESDLVIYVNLNLVPMDGGHKSVTVGLCGYESLRAHHNPKTMRNCHSYMDPKTSALADERRAHGPRHEQGAQRLHDRDDDQQPHVRLAARVPRTRTRTSSREREKTRAQGAALHARRSCRSPRARRSSSRSPRPTASPASSPARPKRCTRTRSRSRFEQYLVPVEGPGDILVTGIPYISPYNVNSFLNPLLVQVLAQGYLFNLYRGAPLVKKGGTMIITHPCTDQFDKEHHAPYIEFVHDLLARDARRDGAAQALRAQVRDEPGVHPDVPNGARLPPGAPVLHVVLGRGGPAAPRPRHRRRRGQRVHPEAPRLRDRADDARSARHGQGHRAADRPRSRCCTSRRS